MSQNNSIYEVHDERFQNLVISSADLDELYSDCRWAEGPVWFGDLNCLLWSDIPNQRILRWVPEGGVSVFRQPSNFANGNTRDREGRLVSCEHGGRRVTRTEFDGSITVLADNYQGKKLNAPNDVIVRSDGSVWFTDPTYGIMGDYEGYKAEPEQPTRNVYRLDPEAASLMPSSQTLCSQMVLPFRLMKQSFLLPTAPIATTKKHRVISGFLISLIAEGASRVVRFSARLITACQMAFASIQTATFGRVRATAYIAFRLEASFSARSIRRKPSRMSRLAGHVVTGFSLQQPNRSTRFI